MKTIETPSRRTRTNKQLRVVPFRRRDEFELDSLEVEMLRNYRSLTERQQFQFRWAIESEADRNVKTAISRAQQQPPTQGEPQ